MSVPKLKRAQLRERESERESGRRAQCDQLLCCAARQAWKPRSCRSRGLFGFGFVDACLALALDSVRHRSQNVFVRCADNILAVTKRGRCVLATYVCLVCMCVQNCPCLCVCMCVCSVRGVENWLHFKNPQDAEQNVKRKGKSKRWRKEECVARNQSKVKCEFCATNSNCRGNFYIIKR